MESPVWAHPEDHSFPLQLGLSDGWALFFSSGCWPMSTWTGEGEEDESPK